jgi:pilus assembly protein CpaC
MKSEDRIKRVSVADPEIADFVLLSPKEIYLTAKKPGTTNLMLWQDSRIAAIYDVEVTYDVSQLKQQLHDVLPNENALRVIASQESITLAGRISNAANLSQALALAKAYAPKGKVNNLVGVGGVHQVMLEVRVAEMARSTTKSLGFNFSWGRNGEFVVSGIGGLADLSTGGLAGAVSESVNALFRFNTGSVTWTGLIDALREDGLAKVLAEPTLIALSGQTADFLAGGEFPVPIPQGLGTVGIEYKPFGVGLSFTPTVLSDNRISIKVTPEVSELDFTIATQTQGFLVPGITTRRASTTIELGDGQSFAIAGLLKDTARNTISKYPLLGEIPVLGALFQSKEFQKNESELIIIATPHLVKPVDGPKQPLPTDYYVEPSNAEFYLFGMMEGKENNNSSKAKGDFDGDFGHAMPDAK